MKVFLSLEISFFLISNVFYKDKYWLCAHSFCTKLVKTEWRQNQWLTTMPQTRNVHISWGISSYYSIVWTFKHMYWWCLLSNKGISKWIVNVNIKTILMHSPSIETFVVYNFNCIQHFLFFIWSRYWFFIVLNVGRSVLNSHAKQCIANDIDILIIAVPLLYIKTDFTLSEILC